MTADLDDLADALVYDRVGFPVREKDFSKIEKKNNFCINVFCYENKLTFPIYVSDQKFEYSMDLLLERLEKGTIEFKMYFKQIPVPFKIYADFECNLKSVESYEGSYSKKIKITFLVVLLTNLFVLMINLPSQ